MLLKLTIIFTLFIMATIALSVNYYKNFKGNDNYKLYMKNYHKIDKKMINEICDYFENSPYNNKGNVSSHDLKKKYSEELLNKFNEPIILMNNGVDRFYMKENLYNNIEYFTLKNKILNDYKLSDPLIQSEFDCLLKGVFYIDYNKKDYDLISVIKKIKDFNFILNSHNKTSLDDKLISENILLFEISDNSFMELDTYLRFMKVQVATKRMKYTTITIIIDLLMAAKSINDYEDLMNIYSKELENVFKERPDFSTNNKLTGIRKAVDIGSEILTAYYHYDGSMPLEWHLELFLNGEDKNNG